MRVEVDRRARGRGCCTASSISSDAARVGAAGAADVARWVSAICWPTRITGSSENFGSCSTIDMRWPRSPRKPRSSQAEEVDVAEGEARSAVTRPAGGTRPRMARPVVDLPEPRFADDAEPLAAEREGDAAHGVDSRRSSPG